MDCFSTRWIVQIVKSFCLICKDHKSTSKQLAFETILVHWFLWASNPLDRDLLLTSVGAGWDLKGSLLDWKSWDECLVYKWFILSWSKSLKFLSDNSLLLNRYIEVRSRLCWEIKCPRLAEVLQLSPNAKDVCVQISAPISSLKVLWTAAWAQTWPGGTFWHLLPVGAPLPSYCGPYICTEGQILLTALERNKMLCRMGVYVTLAICICHLFLKMWSRGCGYAFAQQLQGHSAYSTDELTSQHHLVLWAGNIEARAKIFGLWKREGGQRHPEGQEQQPREGGMPSDSTCREPRIPGGERSSSRWCLTRNRLKQLVQKRDVAPRVASNQKQTVPSRALTRLGNEKPGLISLLNTRRFKPTYPISLQKPPCYQINLERGSGRSRRWWDKLSLHE